jgi:hypothetical protein
VSTFCRIFIIVLPGMVIRFGLMCVYQVNKGTDKFLFGGGEHLIFQGGEPERAGNVSYRLTFKPFETIFIYHHKEFKTEEYF